MARSYDASEGTDVCPCGETQRALITQAVECPRPHAICRCDFEPITEFYKPAVRASGHCPYVFGCITGGRHLPRLASVLKGLK